MDPLSVTASIIAVLQATSAVVSICYDYSSAVEGSSWELLRVIDEVRGLRNVLESLEQLARQAGSTKVEAENRLPSLRLLCEPRTGILAKCLMELTDLDKKLRPQGWSGPAGSKRRALIQASGWPLKKGAVERALVNIGRLKETISLAITADEAKLIMAIQDTSKTILETTIHTRNDLSTLFEKATLKATEDLETKIYEWLSAPDPSSNYNKAREVCQAKTGSWFLQSKQFSDWKIEENTFLWLYGIPGCGKTILSSTIVENVIHSCQKMPCDTSYFESGFAAVYFYFDFNDVDKQSYEKMIRSLIMQLSTQNGITPQPVRSAFESCANGQRQPTTDTLLETLHYLIQDYQKVFLILDALDECAERLELLSVLKQIASWKSGICILVTSRIEADIGENLDLIGPRKICIQSNLVDNDIRAYVRERLNNDWKLRRWKKHPVIQNEIEKILMEKAAGMFRWAVCQLDALGKCLTVPMLRKALKSLPSTLDETYARILRNIDESWGQSVARILEWLVFSATPLRLTEVAELVAIDIDDDPPFDPNRRLPEPKDILTMCSSLITMTKEKVADRPYGQVNYEDITHEYDDYEDIDNISDIESPGDDNVLEESKIIVRLAHFSVKEYLVSRQLRVGPTIQYSILEVPVNISIAEMCLVYLLQFDKPDSLTPHILESFPLLRYASRNWLTHARMAGNNSNRLNSLIMRLFLEREVCKNWIRIFDPERVSERPSVWQYVVQPCSPLYYCSLGGLLEPARRLIENGADVNLQEGDLGCSLLAALKTQHEDVARLLVDSGADVAASAPSWPVGMTALHCAARDGYEFLAADLLSKGAAVEVKTDAGETPLHMAVENGHIEIVMRLINHGAIIDAQDNVGKVPLYHAVVNKDPPMIKILLEKGAATEAKDHLGRTIIFIAVETRQLDIVHLLLDRAPNLHVADIRGQCLIHYAAASGLVTVVELLLDDVDKEDDFGRTALHTAADAGHENVVQFLLLSKANIEARTTSGQTPLYYATVAGHEAVVRQLLDQGASIKARDDYGASILYAAATAGEKAEAVVDLLLAEIEQKSKSGRTLLHHAVVADDTTMVKRLIRRGADLDARTATGETPLYLAMIRGYDDIVRLLRGAKMTPRSEASYSDEDNTDYLEKLKDGVLKVI